MSRRKQTPKKKGKNHDIYEVEKIVGYSHDEDLECPLWFKVKWVGYKKLGWVAEDQMYCKELIVDFWRDHFMEESRKQKTPPRSKKNSTVASPKNPTVAPIKNPTVASPRNATVAPSRNRTVSPPGNLTVAPPRNPTVALPRNPTVASPMPVLPKASKKIYGGKYLILTVICVILFISYLLFCYVKESML